MFDNNYKNYNSISNKIILAIFCISLVFVMVVGVTLAWLTDSIVEEGNSTIGEVGIEIYSGNTKLNGELQTDGSYVVGTPLEVAFSSLNTTVNVNLSVKNTGTIPGIVRCFVTITNDEGPHDHFTDLDGAKFIMRTNQMSATYDNWIMQYDDPALSDLYSFNAYLNESIEAGDSVDLIKTLTPTADGLNNTSVYIYLRAEIVAYSGNAYQVGASSIDKPFGDLSQEFLNQWTAWQ